MFPLFRIYQKTILPFRRATTTGIEPALFLTSILAPLLTKIRTISSWPGTSKKNLFEELSKTNKKKSQKITTFRCYMKSCFTQLVDVIYFGSKVNEYFYAILISRTSSFMERSISMDVYHVDFSSLCNKKPNGAHMTYKISSRKFWTSKIWNNFIDFFFQKHFHFPVDKQIFIQNWSHPGCRRAVKKKEKLSYRF